MVASTGEADYSFLVSVKPDVTRFQIISLGIWYHYFSDGMLPPMILVEFRKSVVDKDRCLHGGGHSQLQTTICSIAAKLDAPLTVRKTPQSQAMNGDDACPALSTRNVCEQVEERQAPSPCILDQDGNLSKLCASTIEAAETICVKFV